MVRKTDLCNLIMKYLKTKLHISKMKATSLNCHMINMDLREMVMNLSSRRLGNNLIQFTSPLLSRDSSRVLNRDRR